MSSPQQPAQSDAPNLAIAEVKYSLPDLLNEKPDSYVLDITDGHALSPAHECVFEMDGLTFYTVIHAVCYRGDIGKQISMAESYAFGFTGGAGGILNERGIVWLRSMSCARP